MILTHAASSHVLTKQWETVAWLELVMSMPSFHCRSCRLINFRFVTVMFVQLPRKSMVQPVLSSQATPSIVMPLVPLAQMGLSCETLLVDELSALTVEGAIPPLMTAPRQSIVPRPKILTFVRPFAEMRWLPSLA